MRIYARCGRETNSSRCYNRVPMKAVLTFVLASCIGSVLPPPAPTPRVSEDVKAVRQVMAELTAAKLRYDFKAVDRLLDEDFIYVGNDGSLTSRLDFISLTDRERNPFDLLEITDVDVRTTGDTAIATGLIHERGLLDGRPYEFWGRTLTTFVRKSGRWHCLAMHD